MNSWILTKIPSLGPSCIIFEIEVFSIKTQIANTSCCTWGRLSKHWNFWVDMDCILFNDVDFPTFLVVATTTKTTRGSSLASSFLVFLCIASRDWVVSCVEIDSLPLPCCFWDGRVPSNDFHLSSSFARLKSNGCSKTKDIIAICPKSKISTMFVCIHTCHWSC